MNDFTHDCWNMFVTTGEVSYYMLYKALKEEEVGTNKIQGDCFKEY